MSRGISGMSERQRQMDNGRLVGQEENLEALLHLLWAIRAMDIDKDYSMANSLQRVRERGGDGMKIAKITEPQVLKLLEKWAGEIRAFLADQTDCGAQN